LRTLNRRTMIAPKWAKKLIIFFPMIWKMNNVYVFP
jgi:hypothetical protein